MIAVHVAECFKNAEYYYTKHMHELVPCISIRPGLAQLLFTFSFIQQRAWKGG